MALFILVSVNVEAATSVIVEDNTQIKATRPLTKSPVMRGISGSLSKPVHMKPAFVSEFDDLWSSKSRIVKVEKSKINKKRKGVYHDSNG